MRKERVRRLDLSDGGELLDMLTKLQAFCRENGLPDITVLVIDKGRPVTWETSGRGIYTAAKFLQEMDYVCMVNWDTMPELKDKLHEFYQLFV